MDRWLGKVAVVTGASSGIGAEITVDLVKAGMIVVGLARRVERIEQLRKRIPDGTTGKLFPFLCDVSNDESVTEAFKWIDAEFGAIHVLVNNAGHPTHGLLTEAGNEERLKSVLQTNVWGLVLCTKKAVEIMKRANVVGAHVFNINSVSGHRVLPWTSVNFPAPNIYPPSKFAVTALTEVLRQEFNHDNFQFKVSVRNCLKNPILYVVINLCIILQSISPGAVRTEFREASLYERVVHLEPEDVSQAVLYALATPPHVNVSEIIIKAVGTHY